MDTAYIHVEQVPIGAAHLAAVPWHTIRHVRRSPIAIANVYGLGPIFPSHIYLMHSPVQQPQNYQHATNTTKKFKCRDDALPQIVCVQGGATHHHTSPCMQEVACDIDTRH